MNRGLRIRQSAFLVAAIALAGVRLLAQSEESDLPSGVVAPTPAGGFAFPDVSDKTLADANHEDKFFTLKLGLVVLGDYSAFSQDAASITQVGKQEDKSEFRSFRLMCRGKLSFLSDWNYLISAEYKGFGQDDGADDWAMTDVSFTHSLGAPHRTITVGKTKEPYVYEMVGDAANLPQSERILSPFFVSRNVGVKISDVILDQRLTWSVGVFNNWWTGHEDFSTSGTEVTGRVTWLPFYSDDGKNFLHLGASFRYNGADNDTLRFRGRPESNVTSYYVDTGDIAADHAWQTGLEALWNAGPFSILAEFANAQVSGNGNAPNYWFSGWYVTGSWVVTGETRPYDRNVGYARRVMPAGRWGAPEIISRIMHLDLDNHDIRGGTLTRFSFGVNWWATRRWKLGFEWGRTLLDRSGLEGHTNSLLTRLQWIH